MKTGCVAAEIVVDDRGRARGVRYFDANDQPQEQPADMVVVSASATETARLLLNSKSKLFPNGAGNNNDWVGRNLQGHGYVRRQGSDGGRIYEEAGLGATVAFCDFNHGNPGLAGGGMLANEFIGLPYLFCQRAPAGRAALGQSAQGFSAPVLQALLPSRAHSGDSQFRRPSHVDPAVKDPWGIPVCRLSGTRHPYDLELGEFL